MMGFTEYSVALGFWKWYICRINEFLLILDRLN